MPDENWAPLRGFHCVADNNERAVAAGVVDEEVVIESAQLLVKFLDHGWDAEVKIIGAPENTHQVNATPHLSHSPNLYRVSRWTLFYKSKRPSLVKPKEARVQPHANTNL